MVMGGGVVMVGMVDVIMDHVLMAGTMVGVIETRAMKRMLEQDV